MSEKERDEAEASKVSTQTFQLVTKEGKKKLNLIFIFCYILAIF